MEYFLYIHIFHNRKDYFALISTFSSIEDARTRIDEERLREGGFFLNFTIVNRPLLKVETLPLGEIFLLAKEREREWKLKNKGHSIIFSPLYPGLKG